MKLDERGKNAQLSMILVSLAILFLIAFLAPKRVAAWACAAYLPAILVADSMMKASRKRSDRQKEERQKEREEEPTMEYLPAIRRPFHSTLNALADPYPYLTSLSAPENPLTALSRSSPVLAHDVFKKRSQDELTTNLANSAVATEFAKKGWGTFVAT